MQLEVPTAAGLMYSDTGGDGPVAVLLHGVLIGGSLWDTVVDGLRGRYRCIVPGLPFGAHTTPMPDDLFRSWIHPPLRDLTEPRLSPLSTRDALSNLRLRRRDSDEVRVAGHVTRGTVKRSFRSRLNRNDIVDFRYG